MTDGNGPAGLGRSLRSLREAHQLAPGELARRVGATPDGLCAIEAGTSLPSAGLLLRLSEFFSVDPCYFFGSTVPQPSVGTEPAQDLTHLDGLVDDETLDLLTSLTGLASRRRG